MALLLEKNTTQYKVIEAGTYTAIIYGVVDLGTHLEEVKNKQGVVEKKLFHKIRIFWELPDEKLDDGRPMSISKEVTFSFGDRANLKKIINASYTKEPEAPFDVFNLISRACNLGIINYKKADETNGAAIETWASLKKTDVVPPMSNEPLVLSLNKDFSRDAFDSLPDWLRKKIEQSPEYLEITGQTVKSNSTSMADELNDVVPF